MFFFFNAHSFFPNFLPSVPFSYHTSSPLLHKQSCFSFLESTSKSPMPTVARLQHEALLAVFYDHLLGIMALTRLLHLQDVE